VRDAATLAGLGTRTEILELSRRNADEAQDFLRQLEVQVVAEAARVVLDALGFYELPAGYSEGLDPSTGKLEPDPPADWVAQLGAEEARKRMRRVLAGQANNAQSPVAIKVATAIYAGSMRARVDRPAATNLNVVLARIDVTQPTEYPVQVLETK
jgi:hypothetical protein